MLDPLIILIALACGLASRAVGMPALIVQVITGILLYIYSRSIWLTILPLTCSLVAVIWQMGSLSLMDFSLDPMNILTPFLIFAIGVSHGVQMISAWIVEKKFGGRTPDDWVRSGVQSLEEIPHLLPHLVQIALRHLGILRTNLSFERILPSGWRG